MESCLIIPAPIRSHIIPSLYLAELFSDNYNIHYATHSGDLAGLVSLNAYGTYPLNEERFALGFDPLTAYNKHKQKISLRFLVEAIGNSLQMNVYRKRREALCKILQQTNPSIILIDIFSSTDFLILQPLYPGATYLFFSPMLNTYNLKDEENSDVISSRKTKTVFQRIKQLTSPYNFLSKLTGYNPAWQIKRIYRRYPSLKKHLPDHSNQQVRMFSNVPELLLAPLELEYKPSIQKSHQLYLGLSQADRRADSQVDEAFTIQFANILRSKNENNRNLIYCSFGSYFSTLEEYKSIAAFCALMVKAFHDSNLEFIVSVNQTITRKIKEIIDLPKNFHFFYRVEQTNVLQFSDVFVTHGGLGSIKEAIHYAVPVLVYPLDQTWDQPGNASKVEFHELGVKGSFRTDGAHEIRSNILTLLHNKKYKENMMAFRKNCEMRYEKKATSEAIKNLIEKYKVQ